MKRKIWRQKDSSNINIKVGIRKAYLPEKAKVLDLFCGYGEIYQRVYKGNVQAYLGIDHLKIHDPELCRLIKNTVFVAHNDISEYNVFDLDDYGSPWMLLYLILKKRNLQDELTIFITDGLPLHLQMTGKVVKMISATESIPRNMVIPAMNRWYAQICSTMLLDIERRYGWKVFVAYL